MKYPVFLLIIIMNSAFVFSSESTKVFFYNVQPEKTSAVSLTLTDWQPILESESTSVDKPKAQKLKAVLLALFLGHFGVHRIYLGTSANVPVVYSLTLGGGFGLLPLMDIIAIITSKDLSEFYGNDQVIMWSK